ncbi:MAG: SelT/SelW/SelH family protein [Pseudomonadota bacterium]|nr:MAG: SelT/SelW/SelH family protein [Pseudomonadota bacterium]
MTTTKSHVEIEYCSQCRFILRASWMAQELLMTFDEILHAVTLVPGSGGIFEVRLDGEPIWNKERAGRFPEPKEIKQLIRDRIAPDKDLGHSDRRKGSAADVSSRLRGED